MMGDSQNDSKNIDMQQRETKTLEQFERLREKKGNFESLYGKGYNVGDLILKREG